MISVDTNILFYATFDDSIQYEKANGFLNELNNSESEVVLCELVLAELYILLRNPMVYKNPMTAKSAVAIIQNFRTHPRWRIVENAPVMEKVWELAATPSFARRRLFDIRLALTLQHHRITEFATANTKDFNGLGFNKVWNPLG